MAGHPEPFEDVRMSEDGFSIPELKWRELVFIGALREERPGVFVRDAVREMAPFRQEGLFPAGRRYEVSRGGGRVHLRPLEGG